MPGAGRGGERKGQDYSWEGPLPGSSILRVLRAAVLGEIPGEELNRTFSSSPGVSTQWSPPIGQHQARRSLFQVQATCPARGQGCTETLIPIHCPCGEGGALDNHSGGSPLATDQQPELEETAVAPCGPILTRHPSESSWCRVASGFLGVPPGMRVPRAFWTLPSPGIGCLLTLDSSMECAVLHILKPSPEGARQALSVAPGWGGGLPQRAALG